MKSKIQIVVISILAILVTYLPFIFYHDKVLGYDWTYFNTLALFIKSSFLTYHKLPLHDPWVCGGMDVLSNPQNWIFSPLVLLTIVFGPYFSNIISLVILSFFGLWGCYKFFTYFKVSFGIALGVAMLYVNCAWLGLHFIEGHIVYRTFLLFPYILYLFYTINYKKHFLILVLLGAFILLDGGMYTFIFSTYLYLVLLIVDSKVRKAFISYMKETPLELVAGTIIFFMIAAIKIVPVILSQELVVVKAVIDSHPLNLYHIISIFFSMFKTNNSVVPDWLWRYHEFGCYIGPVIAITTFYGFLARKLTIENYLKEIIVIMFFFIIASGVGGDFNPWFLMQKIPLIQKAHVQSRYFLICFIYFLLLFTQVLQKIERKKIIFWILIVTNLEFIVARNVIAIDAFKQGSHKNYFDRLIDNKTIVATHNEVSKLDVYYLKNIASKECYEPARPITHVRDIEGANYRGEAYSLPDGLVNLNLKTYIPGHIELDYKVKEGDNNNSDDVIVVNTNMNNEWRLQNSHDGYELIKDQSNLLKIRIEKARRQGTIILNYVPKFFYFLLSIYFLGILSMCILLLNSKGRNNNGRKSI